MHATDTPASTSLQERKKGQARKLISFASERLFAERGFGNVTVAEKVDACNETVKTVFTYFYTKEELVFSGKNAFCGNVIDRIKARRCNEGELDALEAALADLLTESQKVDVVTMLDGFPGYYLSPRPRFKVADDVGKA